MSAEVYFAAFLEVIGFSGCCCCANGRKSTCRRDSEKSEWFLLFTVLAEKYDRHPGVTDTFVQHFKSPSLVTVTYFIFPQMSPIREYHSFFPFLFCANAPFSF